MGVAPWLWKPQAAGARPEQSKMLKSQADDATKIYKGETHGMAWNLDELPNALEGKRWIKKGKDVVFSIDESLCTAFTWM